jgi:hypothetical protein
MGLLAASSLASLLVAAILLGGCAAGGSSEAAPETTLGASATTLAEATTITTAAATSASGNYAVGDTGPAGGIVFYDKGNDEGGWRYLEAAPASTGWERKEWGPQGVEISGADGTAIGSGQQNTADIVASLGPGSTYAAQLCDGLTTGGFDDWFLPSLEELGLINTNLYGHGLGGLVSGQPTDGYWSSSESGPDGAGFWCFDLGYQYPSKDSEVRVRAIRAFTSAGGRETVGGPASTVVTSAEADGARANGLVGVWQGRDDSGSVQCTFLTDGSYRWDILPADGTLVRFEGIYVINKGKWWSDTPPNAGEFGGVARSNVRMSVRDSEGATSSDPYVVEEEEFYSLEDDGNTLFYYGDEAIGPHAIGAPSEFNRAPGQG